MNKTHGQILLKTAALTACMLVLVRHAWVCDDAFITLRTVRNFLNGDGLRWNLHERVQSFTHPLWMMVLSVSVRLFRDPVASALVPALGLSLTMLWLIAFRSRLAAPAAILALACLVSSKSFVDYSTSGLENPLTHLLFVVLVSEYLGCARANGLAPSRRVLLRITLMTALIGLTRLDGMVAALPLLVCAYRRRMESARDLGRTLLAGFSPLILWEAFSVVYYGFPFPNTAYAKLAGGIPAADLWLQGVLYYLSQLAFDPFSLMATAWAFLFVLVRRERALYALAAGLGLDLIYIVSIGGDFMAGRHFSLVVLMAAMVLAHALSDLLKASNYSSYIPAAATIAAGMVMSPHPPIAMSPDYVLAKNPISNEAWDERGVCDERAFYSVSVALLRANRDTNMPNNWHKGRGVGVPPTAVEAMAQVGVAGFFAPPTAIIIDSYGLGDAFIARLPAAKKVGWRPGHYAREIPSGYADTLREGRNLLGKREDAWLYNRVKLVASGPIWSWERWKEIVRLNLGLSPPDVVVPDRPRKKQIR